MSFKVLSVYARHAVKTRKPHNYDPGSVIGHYEISPGERLEMFVYVCGAWTSEDPAGRRRLGDSQKIRLDVEAWLQGIPGAQTAHRLAHDKCSIVFPWQENPSERSIVFPLDGIEADGTLVLQAVSQPLDPTPAAFGASPFELPVFDPSSVSVLGEFRFPVRMRRSA